MRFAASRILPAPETALTGNDWPLAVQRARLCGKRIGEAGREQGLDASSLYGRTTQPSVPAGLTQSTHMH